MKIARYIPDNDILKRRWLSNFAAKLSKYCDKYNITPDELNDIRQFTQKLDYWLNFRYQYRLFDKSLTIYTNSLILGNKNDIPPTLPDLGAPPPANNYTSFKTIRSITQRIKTHYKYSMSDGLDLGIEGPKKGKVDFDNIKPDLKARLVNGGKVEIVWKKNGMDRIEIHVDRGDGYKLLDFDTHPNYIDNFKLPRNQTAIWKYHAVYIHNDKRVGQWSDEVQITVTGMM